MKISALICSADQLSKIACRDDTDHNCIIFHCRCLVCTSLGFEHQMMFD